MLKGIGLKTGTKDSILASCCSFYFLGLVFKNSLVLLRSDLMTIKGQIRVIYESMANKCTPQVGDIGEVCLVGHMIDTLRRG